MAQLVALAATNQSWGESDPHYVHIEPPLAHIPDEPQVWRVVLRSLRHHAGHAIYESPQLVQALTDALVDCTPHKYTHDEAQGIVGYLRQCAGLRPGAAPVPVQVQGTPAGVEVTTWQDGGPHTDAAPQLRYDEAGKLHLLPLPAPTHPTAVLESDRPGGPTYVVHVGTFGPTTTWQV